MPARQMWSVGVAVGERCAHGIDRNPGCEAREEEPADTNPDRKYARKRLLRHDIAITNCEAGDEGEIDRVADRPTLDKANQQAQGNLNRQNRRQDRPRDMNGVAQLYEKAAPHGLWWRPIHAHSLLHTSTHTCRSAQGAHPHATTPTSFEVPAPFCVAFKARLAISYLMRSSPPVERGHPRQRIAEKCRCQIPWFKFSAAITISQCQRAGPN